MASEITETNTIEHLERLLEEKDMAIALVAHNIKNELISLKLAHTLLKKAADSGTEHFSKFFEYAERSHMRIEKIVEELSKDKPAPRL